MKKSFGQKPVKPDKYCNNCGNMTGSYEVVDNGIFCHECFPVLEKPKKKVPTENQMLTKILEKKDEK